MLIRTNAWELRKFNKIVNLSRGLTYKPKDIRKRGIRVLRSSNISENIFKISDEDVFVDPSVVNISLVSKNNILITAANGSSKLVGKHALITTAGAAVPGGFMLVAKSDSPFFVNSLMSSPWYAKFISTFVSGGNGAIGNLKKGDLENQRVYIPNITEQQKIGSFFKHLDELITLHQRNEKFSS